MAVSSKSSEKSICDYLLSAYPFYRHYTSENISIRDREK